MKRDMDLIRTILLEVEKLPFKRSQQSVGNPRPYAGRADLPRDVVPRGWPSGRS